MLEFLERLHRSTSLDEVCAHLCEAMNGFGFDRLIYGFSQYISDNSLGQLDDLIVLSNHDPAYLRPYLEQGMFRRSAMVRWGLDHDGVQSWSWLDSRKDELTEAEREVVEFNRKFGIVAGFSISLRGAMNRSRGIIGLAARRDLSHADAEKIWAEHGREIHMMCQMAHLKILSLPHTGQRRTLTSRQREVLEWVSEGKTTHDIATIMDLTPATVEKHLRLAREKLQVETTAQAVLKATLHNQIFVL